MNQGFSVALGALMMLFLLIVGAICSATGADFVPTFKAVGFSCAFLAIYGLAVWSLELSLGVLECLSLNVLVTWWPWRHVFDSIAINETQPRRGIFGEIFTHSSPSDPWITLNPQMPDTWITSNLFQLGVPALAVAVFVYQIIRRLRRPYYY